MIESCAFGTMTIGGQEYTSDLMIFPDGRVKDNWWRPFGHRLALEDMAPLIAVAPGVIVAGMGIYGRMHAVPDLEAMLAEKGIDLVTDRTEAAVRIFNDLRRRRGDVAGCFHLTC
ncbi:Mth938-like domain-containing protein [Desulfatitalea tepidiphila]|uniref:Mth938-like domain-containing protein n=1 Tax=Desulfatitalea tepidiphila TaxID=1185843 RepID=UPI0006B43413|nr:MTH938/NDUFAF3 family protein [Desulfatitalea tepidiphila]